MQDADTKKRKHENVIGLTLLVFFFGLLPAYQAYSEYSWAGNQIEREQAAGFVVLKRFDNVSYLSEPWTFIWPPISQIIFTDPDLTEDVTIQGVVPVMILRVDRSGKRNLSVCIVDLTRQQFVFVEGERFAEVGLPKDATMMQMTKWPGLDFIFDYARKLAQRDRTKQANIEAS